MPGGKIESYNFNLDLENTGTLNGLVWRTKEKNVILEEVGTDHEGGKVYRRVGTWISDVFDMGGKYHDLEEVTMKFTNSNGSVTKIYSRVSDNNEDWTEWSEADKDNKLTSPNKRYVQIKIEVTAGLISKSQNALKSDYNTLVTNHFKLNDFVTYNGATMKLKNHKGTVSEKYQKQWNSGVVRSVKIRRVDWDRIDGIKQISSSSPSKFK